MSEFNAEELLINVFQRLKRTGLSLGLNELLDVVRAIQGGWGREGQEELGQVARLLWCNSLESIRDFDAAWAAAITAALDLRPTQLPKPSLTPPATPMGEPEMNSPLPTQETSAGEVLPEQEFAALPVQAPFTPVTLDESMRLDAYWPVTRRSMSYTWRYLRRMLPDGPADVVDVQATVERAARQGFYLAPIFRRRQLNHANLILLLDQNGSMVPFHRFTRDVSETATRESAIAQVEIYYFHIVIGEHLYRDPYLTEPINWDVAMARCDGETSVLIVSDAGAARGFRRLPRIRATADFLARMRQHTVLTAWLNPLPDTRWTDTSAAVISQFVKMYQMDPDGFSSAIDVVRGQQF
jgi:uncharacterized protein with von Willebrand factor type A (vWA) domain